MGKILRKESRNVFDDLGFDEVEAVNLKLRSDLMITLREYISNRGWTQSQAAEFFGVTQPRVSNLMKGRIDRFSIDSLVTMLARAGMRVTMEVMRMAA